MIVRPYGRCDYLSTWRAMQRFTAQRQACTPDELWCLEHPAVFTQGFNGKPRHLLDAGDIPVIQTDRGGQITYHGPGQLIIYLLVDLHRRALGVRAFVGLVEQAIVAWLAGHGVSAGLKAGARGVYIEGDKIAAIGLRVSRGCTYHGLSLNVDMDLAPFTRIHPCGYEGLGATQLRDQGILMSNGAVAVGLCRQLKEMLSIPTVDQPNRELS